MELINTKTYSEFKQALDTELQKSAEGFVKIGFLLKIARDTNILAESGYANVNDFAAREYGLDKSQVSRFININDRFSENGYSENLLPEYRGYGYAKLALMLNIPDAVLDEISPAYSKSEIQAIKDEVDAETAIPPIETYLEGEKEEQQVLPSLIDKVLNQLFHDEPGLFSLLHHQIKNGGENKDIKDVIAPSGDSFYSVRIQGFGRKFLTTKENIENVTITDARNGEKEMYTWQDIIYICRAMVNKDMDAADNWTQIYGEQYPVEEKKNEVAPVQHNKKDDKKPVPKKISKVTKAKTVKKPEKPKADELSKAAEKKPLDGQKTIENYPEVLPNNENETLPAVNETLPAVNETLPAVNETLPAAVEMAKKPENPKADMPLEMAAEARKAYLENLEFQLDEVMREARFPDIDAAKYHIEEAIKILDKLAELPEPEEEDDIE